MHVIIDRAGRRPEVRIEASIAFRDALRLTWSDRTCLEALHEAGRSANGNPLVPAWLEEARFHPNATAEMGVLHDGDEGPILEFYHWVDEEE